MKRLLLGLLVVAGCTSPTTTVIAPSPPPPAPAEPEVSIRRDEPSYSLALARAEVPGAMNHSMIELGNALCEAWEMGVTDAQLDERFARYAPLNPYRVEIKDAANRYLCPYVSRV